MTITLRAVKGSALIHAEMDENFRVVQGIAPPTLVENDNETEIVNTSRGRWKSIVSAPPSSLGTHSGILTAFDGDISKVQLPIEHRITGDTTLGQPTSGYLYTPEAYASYTFMYNTSGYNHSTSQDDGRTAAIAHRTVVHHGGNGDGICYNASVLVYGAKSGATVWPANPAGVCFNGGVFAGADGVHLNGMELVAQDQGYDVACNQFVSRLYRTNGTAALGAWWTAFRAQSQGAVAADVAFSVSGPFKRGLDLVLGDFSTDNVAISMKAGQKIAFNMSATGSGYSTNYNNSSMYYNTGTSSILILVNNSTAANLHATNAASLPNGLTIGSGKVYSVNGVQVVAARDTGWSAMTGATNKATVYDTATVTLAQLAGRVMAMQAALTTHGLIGT